MPCPFDALWAPASPVAQGDFMAQWAAIPDAAEVSGPAPAASFDAASAKLQARNCHFISKRDAATGCFCVGAAGAAFLVELTVGGMGAKVSVRSANRPLAQHCLAAVVAILAAP